MKQGVIIAAALAVIGLIIAGVTVIGKKSNTTIKEKIMNPSVSPQSSAEAAAGGLKSTDIVVGTGDEAVAGKSVTVNYNGTLTDGTKFDSSYDRNQPFTFTLGAGDVIKGWDQGVVGMKVGGKRNLVIPAALGYGDRGSGDKIKPGATLVFDIELLEVK